MYAKRMNKSYQISTPQEKKAYLERGYDIYDDDGNIIEYSAKKTVPYGEHAALLKKYEELEAEYNATKAELEDMEAAYNTAKKDLEDLISASGREDAPPEDSGEQKDSEVKTLQSPGEKVPKMGKKK
jgi:hypothetical protein